MEVGGVGNGLLINAAARQQNIASAYCCGASCDDREAVPPRRTSKKKSNSRILELGQTKHPKPSGCFGGSPFKKREALGDVRTFCLSVCLSRTICVCTGEKWFRTFVRGTVRTENEIVSVCVSLSSTICVYRTAKWFNPFVRGTFETDSQYNLEKRTATVLPTLFQC